MLYFVSSKMINLCRCLFGFFVYVHKITIISLKDKKNENNIEMSI